jgi:hypothetical protein
VQHSLQNVVDGVQGVMTRSYRANNDND